MAKSVLLTTKQIQRQSKKLPNWTLNSKSTFLARTFTFENHVDALVFIARITVHSEVLQHHPDITYTYAKVKVKMTTHEYKGLTKKDFELAKRIDGLCT